MDISGAILLQKHVQQIQDCKTSGSCGDADGGEMEHVERLTLGCVPIHSFSILPRHWRKSRKVYKPGATAHGLIRPVRDAIEAENGSDANKGQVFYHCAEN